MLRSVRGTGRPSRSTHGRRYVVVLAGVAVLTASGLVAGCGTRVDKAAYLAKVQSGYGVDASSAVRDPAAVAAPAAGGAPATLAPGKPSAAAGGGTAARAGGNAGGATAAGGGSAGGGTAAGGTRAGGGASAGGSAVAGSGGGTQSGGGANPYGLSTSAVGNTVEIGFHLPETGAAPLPMGWAAAVTTVEKWLNAKPINGRKVHINTVDDGYDPTTGMAACKKLLGSKPLIVVGWTMPEVMRDCSQLFSKNKIPYLARGSFSDIVNVASPPLSYFLSMSDELGGKVAADYVMGRMGGANKKIGQVWENDQPASPKAFVDEIKARGGKVVVNDSSVPRKTDFTATITKLSQAGVQIVNLSLAPVDAITIATQAQAQGYHPIWFGIGTYWNYNMTVQSAGMAMDGAISLSPWSTIDSAAADEWRAVSQQYGNGQADDIGLVVFGIGKFLQAVLTQAGPNLSTAAVVNTLNSMKYSVPFWAPISFSAGNHYGPTTVAVFQADGQSKRWRQISGFTGGF